MSNVIFDNEPTQAEKDWNKLHPIEKPFIGGIGSIITSLVVLSLLGVVLWFLFLSHSPKQEPITDSRNLIISQLSTEQLRAKQVSADEQGMATEYEQRAQALRSKNQNETQPYLQALEACLDDYLRRLPDPCDPSRFIPSLSMAGLKASPASQPTETSPSPSTQPQNEDSINFLTPMENMLRYQAR